MFLSSYTLFHFTRFLVSVFYQDERPVVSFSRYLGFFFIKMAPFSKKSSNFVKNYIFRENEPTGSRSFWFN